MRRLLAAVICSAIVLTVPAAALAEDPAQQALETADPAAELGTGAVSDGVHDLHQTPVHEAVSDLPPLALVDEDPQVDLLIAGAVGQQNLPSEDEVAAKFSTGSAGLVQCYKRSYRPTYYRRYRHVQGYGDMTCAGTVSGVFRVSLQRLRWWGWQGIGKAEHPGTRKTFTGHGDHTCTRGQTFTYRTVTSFTYNTTKGPYTWGPHAGETYRFTC